VHPEHQLGVVGAVGRTGREPAQPAFRAAVDAGVDPLHRGSGPRRLVLAPEGDQVERAQRSQEALPQIAPVVRVSGDAGGDQRVRHLEQHRGTAAEKRRQRRVPDSTDDAVGREPSVGRRQPLRVRSPPAHPEAYAQRRSRKAGAPRARQPQPPSALVRACAAPLRRAPRRRRPTRAIRPTPPRSCRRPGGGARG